MKPEGLDTTTPSAKESRGWTFVPGQLLAGRYRVRRPLARGGMGEVYEVDDTQLDERVALKTLDSRLAGDEVARARFVSEVKAARQVAHPNVCRLFEFGLHAEGDAPPTPFLTMEFLEGETLAQRLLRGRPGWNEALALCEQLASAVDAAHAAGVVHRDLKPSNVMLVPGAGGATRVVVTDFGIARRLAAPALTEEGAWLGTPAYIAPEQLAGEPVGPAADVYAFGVLLFELATGRLPFEGSSALEVATQRLNRPAPLATSVSSDVPPAWSDAIARCLVRDPAQRWPSLTAAVHGLRGETTGLVAPRRQRPLGLVAILAVGLAAAAGLAAWELSRRTPLPVAEVPPSPCPNAAANDAFRAAMAAHAAGRDDVMVARLEAAMKDAPECGGAALQRAWVSWVYAMDPYPRAREAFRLALGSRATLNERDASFLEAMLPAFADPSDWKTAAQRLERLVSERPGDAQLHEAMGLARIKAGERAGAVEAFARLRALDPGASMGWVMGAQLAPDDEARVALLRACIVAIPEGVDCRRELGTHFQATGACDEVERLGRELTALAPDVPHGYQLRASAAASRGEPTVAVEALLAQARERLAGSEWTASEQATQPAWDAWALALHAGRIDQALEALDRVEVALGDADDEDQRRRLVLQRALLLREEGRGEPAARVAKAWLDGAAARPLPSWPSQDPTPVLLATQVWAGSLDAVTHRRARDAWAASWKARLSPEGWASTWGPVTWALAWTPSWVPVPPEEAREALAAAAGFGGLPPRSRSPATVGALLVAAGRAREALDRLEPAARRCTVAPDPQLLFVLGEARAAAGDPAGACDAWRRLVARFGNHPSEAMSAILASDRARGAGCPGFEDLPNLRVFPAGELFPIPRDAGQPPR